MTNKPPLPIRWKLAYGLAASLSVLPAAAVDLTGTWEGKQTCKLYDGANETEKRSDAPLQISQDGTDLNLMALGVAYTGQLIADAKSPDKKGGAALVDCDSDGLNNGFFGEIATVEITGRGSGFSATSIRGGSGFVATCTWRFKRIDGIDPEVPDCEPAPAPE